MPLSKERAEQIGAHLLQIRLNILGVTEGELREIIQSAQRDSTIGPLTDPTAWQGGERFDQIHRTIEVCEALIQLRRVFDHEAKTHRSKDN